MKTWQFSMKKSPLSMAFIVIMLLFSSLAATAANRLYWGNEGSGAIRFADQNGLGIASDLFAGEGGPCGVAIDPAAGKIYWANFNFNGVRVANLDGSGAASTLFGGEGSLCGVAVDASAGKIYWANFSTNAIRVANLDGSGVALTLFQELPGTAPSGLVLNKAAGKIYWTNQFSDEIRVGNLDGSGLALTLIAGEDNPIGVVVDPVADKIYWSQLGPCCSGPGAIRVANLDGTGISTLFAAEGAPGGLTIDRAENKVYWANFGPGLIRVGNLDGTGIAQTLYGGESLPLFPVLLKVPVNTKLPNISGGAKVGKTLVCEDGEWASDELGSFLFRAPSTFNYQWIKDGADIFGEIQKTFEPTESGTYTCRVIASNEAGETSVISSHKKVKVSKGKGNNKD